MAFNPASTGITNITSIVQSPPHKRQRINPENDCMQNPSGSLNVTNATIPHILSENGHTHIVPKLTSYDIRKNDDIQDANKNPLIDLHKAPSIRPIIESIRLYTKIKKFCIGTESKNSKKIYITSQSPSAGLCSKHIQTALLARNVPAPCHLPWLSFCLMHHQCGCFVHNKPTKYMVHSTFTIPIRWSSYISNCNYPSAVISLEINGQMVGYFFVKCVAPSNLKRMAQPSTFSQFRMSISPSVLLNTIKYDGLEVLIRSQSDNSEYGVGVGYYFTARCSDTLDIVCCMTNVRDTEFVIRCDENAAKQINTIRCKMHIEECSNVLRLFEWQKQDGFSALNNNMNNNNNNSNNNNNNIGNTHIANMNIATLNQLIMPITGGRQPIMPCIYNHSDLNCAPTQYVAMPSVNVQQFQPIQYLPSISITQPVPIYLYNGHHVPSVYTLYLDNSSNPVSNNIYQFSTLPSLNN